MTALIIIVFILGYLAITLEHPLHLDKTVPALLMAALMWACVAIGFYNGWISIVDYNQDVFNIVSGEIAEKGFKSSLLHHLAKTAEILIFLICAMTIVELIDLHNGFAVVKRFLQTKSRGRMLWTIGVLCFFLSAVIDNLTATIVIVTILRVLVTDDDRRMWYVGMAVVAANAGGAWSPMGDVTTTMIWIAEKVTAVGLVKFLIVPSLVCFAVPFLIASFMKVFRGQTEFLTNEKVEIESLLSSQTMLILGLGSIIFVPIFKTITHLPPYLGMILGLGVVWLYSEYAKPEENLTRERRKKYSATYALSKIEMSSILFFLGILMAVAALETLVYGSIQGKEVGTLRYVAEVLQNAIPNQDIVIIFLGICSAIVDNVPLAAAAIVMYSEPTDAKLWHFIAYSVGTGGSMVIIGSAAGVAAMGMEKVPFAWYLKNIGWLAFLGFISGALTFLFLYPLIA